MSRSCAYAGRDTTESSNLGLYAIFKREKQPNDLRKISGTAIQIPEQEGFVAQAIMQITTGKNAKKIKGGEQLTMGNF